VSATIGMLPGSTLPGHIAAQVPAFIELFAQLTQAGVVMVCSTDAGIGPSRPHNVLPYAVVMLVETHGWPAADALRAATSLPARLCRVEDRKGRLAGGFDADILAVAGNPLTDPSALLAVQAVFRQGRRVR